tara:strand:- start:289 stop:1557 length:1269 start_codon:yes stop_codon:yes gene_type:complete
MLKPNSLLVLFFLVFFFFSCNPDEDDILGLDLIEDDEFFIEKHQFSSQNTDFNIQNFQEEGVTGSGSYNLLGSFNDVYFGQSDAAFYMQVLLPSNNIDFEASESNPNIKLELSLPYYQAYGDTLQNLSVSVFEVTQSLSGIDTTQTLASESFAYDNILAQQEIMIDELNDSIQWENQIVSPRLILDLSDSNLGSKILSSNLFDLENNNNFTEFFKGLFLQVEPQTSGAIIYFDTNSPNCFLRMTYTKNDDTQAVIDFPVGGEANTHNYFTHSYENAELLNYLQNEKMDSLIFLQSMGGLAAEIDLSFLSSEMYSDWVVSQATLNIPVYKDNEYNTFPAPYYLVLTEYADSSDVAIQSISGGLFNTVTEEYNFIISQHIQKIISDNHNSILRLYIGGKNSNAERLIIDNHSENAMNLEVHIIK